MSASDRNGNKAASRWHRWLDRWLGIQLVAILGIFRVQRTLPRTIRRIALIKGDGMGDLVLLTGPIRDLRDTFPRARISFWGGGSTVPLARTLTLFHEVHDLDFKKPWRAIRELRSWAADLVIDAGQWSRAEALISGMSGARFVTGFQSESQHRHGLYDAAVVHRNDRHELENFRALLETLGATAKSQPAIDVIENSESRPLIGIPYLVFHMWPSGAKLLHLKRWPKDHWARLAETCIDNGRRIVLTGAKQDVDPSNRWMARFANQRWIDNRAGVSIHETISLLQNAEAVISVNTGVMHLGAVLGVPTIGLHGPTNARRWGPVGPCAIALEVPPPSGGYLHLGFEYPVDANSRKGMETISVPDVVAALSQLIPDFHANRGSEIPELLEV
jgi:ADP-heptose:LPS heptosyltransferase